MFSWAQSVYKGAPFVPSRKKYIKDLLIFGEMKQSDIVCDLGCGDGRILMSGLADHNVSKAVGYEIAPWPYLKTIFLIKYKKIQGIELFRKNFFEADIREATFIYLYLFPKLINNIAYKIAKEGAAETKILCVQFPIDTNKHPEFKLLKSLNTNSIANGMALENTIISEIIANKAPARMHRFGRTRFKQTHIMIKAKEIGGKK